MADKHHFLSEIEEQLLKDWEKEDIFNKSVESRKGGERFSFYDGPPYANGLPHHGHLVPGTIKDAITRYKTMRGYYVPRRTGWDTHGLPIEYKIEQEKGFKSKKDIIEYGIDKFNQACRDSVFTYKAEWEKFYERLGRWADKNDSYATLDNDYIESVWWVFAQIYKKGYVYEDFRSTPYCPRCATPLSNFEVNQGYQDNVKDPSLFVYFQLEDDDRKLLAWTTTPWSLPGNAAVAVNPGEVYVTVKIKDDEGNEHRVILAEKRLSVLDEGYELESEISGEELVGKKYKPVFTLGKEHYDLSSDKLYQVWGSDVVSIEDGTGVLHVAPAFGEDDLELGKANGLPVLTTIDENGLVKDGINGSEFKGLFFKEADNHIIEYLTKQGSVFAAEEYSHTYPFCWRCDTPLLYYATTSWFIAVSKVRDELLKNNQQINWVPKHLQNGRFGKWLEGARDWAFSRSRFWGAPLPIWKTEDGEVVVVESVDELKKLADKPEQIDDLHRPQLDDVTITTLTGKKATRVADVFDVWFESGSMPYAQDHYPFDNKQEMEANFPADFIAEAMDQTRGWFYSLHVIASIIFEKPAFKNVVVNGWVNAADGEKLSKRKKNYTPIDDVFNFYGADSVRYFMMTSPIVHGEDIRFSSDSLREVQRNIFLTLFNTYKFFKTYRDIDGWQAPDGLEEPSSTNLLDQWIIARLNETITHVTAAADAFEIDKATRPIGELIDDLSNWFVRRSRRRFWKSEDDSDKTQAYQTLYYVLIRVCQLMAPWSPFLVDYIYRDVAKGTKLPGSVHLTDWPEASQLNTEVLRDMVSTREIIVEALAQRAAAKIKVRQPLRALTVVIKTTLPQEYLEIIRDEVNLKELPAIATGSEMNVELDTTLSPELQREGMVRELIRTIQSERKAANLNVDDRIKLVLSTSGENLKTAITEHEGLIKNETLAIGIDNEGQFKHSAQAEIDGEQINISLEVAS